MAWMCEDDRHHINRTEKKAPEATEPMQQRTLGLPRAHTTITANGPQGRSGNGGAKQAERAGGRAKQTESIGLISKTSPQRAPDSAKDHHGVPLSGLYRGNKLNIRADEGEPELQ